MQPFAIPLLKVEQCVLLCGRAQILEKCLRRLEWERVAEKTAVAEAEAKEAERLAIQSIDWCAAFSDQYYDQTCLLQKPSRWLHVLI